MKYLNKTYLKTASLIANSCEAVAVLTECDLDKRRAARDFGKHIGLAFQIQDDRLDFISDANKLGKVHICLHNLEFLSSRDTCIYSASMC